MKQHTTPEQTAKLIELGFEKPRYATMFWRDNKEVTEINYILGELIEMLPKEMNPDTLPDMLSAYIDHNRMWTVDYSNILGELYSTYRTELIDALYDMIVNLKSRE